MGVLSVLKLLLAAVIMKMASCQFECPAYDGFFSDKYNCAYYFQCHRGKAYHRVCSAGTLWDPNTRTCNHAGEVECFSSYSCPDPLGLFPLPGDCTRFLNCFKNIPRVQNCPDGLHFNPDILMCDYPMEANCQTY